MHYIGKVCSRNILVVLQMSGCSKFYSFLIKCLCFHLFLFISSLRQISIALIFPEYKLEMVIINISNLRWHKSHFFPELVNSFAFELIFKIIMKRKFLTLAFLALGTTAFVSCSDDDDETVINAQELP